MHRNKCRKYTTSLNLAEANYYNSLIKDSDQSKLFNVIDSLLFSSSHLFHHYQHMIVCLHLLRNSMSFIRPSYWSSGTLCNDQLWCHRTCLLKYIYHSANHGLKNLMLYLKVMLEFIMQCKPKSCSLDPTPTSIVKQCVDVVAKPLTRIINVPLSSGNFPDSLKRGVIRHLSRNKFKLWCIVKLSSYQKHCFSLKYTWTCFVQSTDKLPLI